MIVGLIVEKYDHKKVGLISVVGSYTGGSYNERGVYTKNFNYNLPIVHNKCYDNSSCKFIANSFNDSSY